MGAIAPIAAGLSTVAATLGAANQVVSTVRTITGTNTQRQTQDLALEQLQARQRLQQAQLTQDNTLERERIATQSAQDEEERLTALRRAVARQRANFAGSGVSATGGSSQAVLLGLFDETQDELSRREQLDNLRSRSLDLNASQTSSLNLLQATQLQQRNNLSRLF